MKILHTADWHIGKQLHKQSLSEEMDLFIEWLLSYIKKEKIDLLLISGDIFDVANPASKDREVYFKFLSILIQLGTRTIITGGNHDSIAVLNAPSVLLGHMGITVIGGAKENITEEVIEIKNKKGELEAVVVAVPFLRDKDLRRIDPNQNQDRREAIREGMKQHYRVLSDHCKAFQKKAPIIAMGHLYAKGATISESERDIGNQSSINADIFTDVFDYVALGHIHRPQIVAKNEAIRYSGSPIALSFSEKSDEKSLVLIETTKTNIKDTSIVPIPKQRKLVRLSGDYDKIADQLANYKSDSTLRDFVELQVHAQSFSHSLISKVEALIGEYEDQEDFLILKHSFQFEESSKQVTDFFEENINIEEMKPEEIFETKLASEENMEEDQKQKLKELFAEVLVEVQQND